MALAIDVINRHDPSNKICCQLQPGRLLGKAILAIYITAKDCSSLLTSRSPLVLKVGVWKMAKCVSSYNQRRLSIIHLYTSKRCFSRPSLLTRWSALVLKVGVLYGW